MSLNDKIVELSGDVGIKVLYDSLMSKKLTINKEELIDLLVSNGVYIFFVEDTITMRISQSFKSKELVKIFSALIGKTAIRVAYKMLLNKQINYTDIILTVGTGEVASLAYDMVVANISGNTPVAKI